MDLDAADASRGTKRSAEVAFAPPRRIKALHQDVVNKIAAGENIVAPVHALKELIENAVDAGATTLEIVVKDGGLKLLQITDNGSGINRDDLGILCERFTTSKLKTFQDLTSIGTYGFRGEALASISHIAHLTVTTKTKDADCAYKAFYDGGHLVSPKPGQSADPKPCAGRQGTQILVEDLFYNVQTRRRAFRSANEEYNRILDMVGRYAVHCKHVAFTCKKHGESGAGLAVPASASLLDRICLVYKSTLKNDTIEFSIEDAVLRFKCTATISSANYQGKRTTLLLFINARAVDSTVIRKAVEQTYQQFLPKGAHPFVYLSLEIDPAQADVNVHPTKAEVNFLHEEDIVDLVCDEMREKLSQVDVSRTFKTQSILNNDSLSTNTTQYASIPVIATLPAESQATPARTPAAKIYENNLVRTDSRARKITSMLKTAESDTAAFDGTSGEAGVPNYQITDQEAVPCRLSSITTLRAQVREDMHNGLTNVFAEHAFVGVVDEHRRIAAMQSGIKLYLVDYGMISCEFFYQLGLTDFGNFGSIRLDTPLSLKELLQLAIEHEAATEIPDASRPAAFWDEVLNSVHKKLLNKREMLLEYFSLDISEDGHLRGIPLLLRGYMPCIGKLPRFLLRLGPHVDWTDEKRCFDTFLRELATFYALEAIAPGNSDELQSDVDVASKRRSTEIAASLEHALFPAFKSRLIATHALRGGIREVADLKGLYRVFERC